MNTKKWWLLTGVIILILCVIIGGKVYMDKQKEAEEMISIVQSDEAKKIFENGLKELDSKAFTSEGVIQSYAIDYDSVKHNPMGGVNVTILINKEDSLYVFFTLNNDNKNKLIDDGGGNSSELEKLLGENE